MSSIQGEASTGNEAEMLDEDIAETGEVHLSEDEKTNRLKMENLGSKLLSARTDLLDLTLRNNMLNFRLPKTRGVAIQGRPVGSLFNQLVHQHDTFGFAASIIEEQLDDPSSDDSSPPTDKDTADSGDSSSTPDDGSDDNPLKLITPYDSKQLQRRLLQTYRAARTYIEEQGANTLFLAMGFLEWYESDSSDKSFTAPLVLVPVLLEHDTAREKFTLKFTDEDVVDNLSLKYKMHLDFGLEFPDLEIEQTDENIAGYLESVRELVANRRRWEVHEERLVIGFFSFGKYLMFRDLDPDVWPESVNPLDNDILSALLGDGFDHTPSGIDDHARLDDALPLEDMRTVLDADSSQLTAVVDVAHGRNLVIQGPPGTGKSQTITNVIARAVMDGKNVLFVAEKMAALEVVKSRLERVGLGAACSELHSNKTNKRKLLNELDRTWQLRTAPIAEPEMNDIEYTIQRQKLNDYLDAIYKPIGASGVTPYQAMGTLVQFQQRAKDQAWPNFEVSTQWTREQWIEHRTVLMDLQAFLSELGVPVRHPFWGSHLTEQPSSTEIQKLLVSIQAAQQKLETFKERWAASLKILGVPYCDDWADVLAGLRALRLLQEAPNVEGINVASPRWRDRSANLKNAAQLMRAIHDLRAKHENLLLANTWERDLVGLRGRMLRHQSNALRFLSSDFRKARAEAMAYLRAPEKQKIEDIIDWMNAVMNVQESMQGLSHEEELLTWVLQQKWQGKDSDWGQCSTAIEWLLAFHEKLAAGHIPDWALDSLAQPDIQNRVSDFIEKLEVSFKGARSAVFSVLTELQFSDGQPVAVEEHKDKDNILKDTIRPTITDELDCMETWIREIDRLSGLVRWNLYAERCQQLGLASIPTLVAAWEHAGKSLVDAVTASWYEALLHPVFHEYANLAEFSGHAQWTTVERFRELDSEMTRSTQRLAAMAHLHRIPARDANGGELGVLRREIQKKARHLPIRRLFERAGHAVQGLKPVFMASPLSIATFVPPGTLHFDLVVFDEASQVLPVDAFGAVLRGRQLVVVGDSKQLPPTNFFDASWEDGDDDDDELSTRDMESILGLCASQGMPERMLHWHYRSRHESLVAVSNAEFYDNRLVVYPSPNRTSDAEGLVLHHLENTAYDRGGSRTNRLEARAVAEEVMAHAQAYVEGNTSYTLGVVAFSSAQANAIEDEVDQLRRQNPVTEAFFIGTDEKFFVKNLETVQGDERDIILISVGYGRDSDGYLAMSFGPLGKSGGERRLNVLITRARVRCEVFTNLRSEDIDLHRAKSEGVRVFKEFLKFCESGILDVPYTSEREMDSPFEEAVRDELGRLGYRVDPQVGSAGFFVDLAVVDPDNPGRYLLGIECDGATYHSSRSARDRDRLRQQVLEGLGWRMHRIWSTDWFRDRQKALQKLVAAIKQAQLAPADVAAGNGHQNEAVQDGIASTEQGNGTEMAPASGVPVDRLVEATALTEENPSMVENTPADGVTEPYTMSGLKIQGPRGDLHEVPLNAMADWIRQVVSVENPVHVDVVIRRIADAYGVKRVGTRIRTTYERAMSLAVRQGAVERNGDFLSTKGQTMIPLRSRFDLPNAERRFDWIAPAEIAGVILKLIDTSFGYVEEDLISDTGRELGFHRVTQDMRSTIATVIGTLKEQGLIALEGVNYVRGKG